MQPLQIQGPAFFCRTGHVCCCGEAEMEGGVERQWINRQKAADNSVENTVALFPAVCEFIRLHAVPLAISKYMQLI